MPPEPAAFAGYGSSEARWDHQEQIRTCCLRGGLPAVVPRWLCDADRYAVVQPYTQFDPALLTEGPATCTAPGRPVTLRWTRPQ
ncbi:hypothetical protein [Streptomyces sp. NBC_00557]|uniref:hypothetical protein n=1 Tax=Streptomyces sp. NBC_00557 TaxID=2975776 RepID=UPI002E8046E9|nr:hypothetical protein [Streptomyces sp. NBC_00557]WUC40129.1 hypothetical protein OG956_36270 [Streptomyces sp. NBC_00557]